MKMKNFFMSEKVQPVSAQLVLRCAVGLVIILALAAGYYESRFSIWKTNHLRVLEKFDVQTSQELLNQQWERK